MIEDKFNIQVENEDLSGENFYIKNINRKKFDEMIRKHKIDLENILSNVNCIKDKHKFNYFLRRCNIEAGLGISECVIFLEEYFVKFKKIVSLLDEENIFKIKKELSENFRVNLQTNTLANFIFD